MPQVFVRRPVPHLRVSDVHVRESPAPDPGAVTGVVTALVELTCLMVPSSAAVYTYPGVQSKAPAARVSAAGAGDAVGTSVAAGPGTRPASEASRAGVAPGAAVGRPSVGAGVTGAADAGADVDAGAACAVPPSTATPANSTAETNPATRTAMRPRRRREPPGRHAGEPAGRRRGWRPICDGEPSSILRSVQGSSLTLQTGISPRITAPRLRESPVPRHRSLMEAPAPAAAENATSRHRESCTTRYRMQRITRFTPRRNSISRQHAPREANAAITHHTGDLRPDPTVHEPITLH